jgi:hypothetical protein
MLIIRHTCTDFYPKATVLRNSLILFFLLVSSGLLAQVPLWQGKGRIAISSDGNEHDHDDWGCNTPEPRYAVSRRSAG